jgi:hypothetical protein
MGDGDNEIGAGISPGAVIWFATTNGNVDVIRANEPVHWKPFDTAISIAFTMPPGTADRRAEIRPLDQSGHQVTAPAGESPFSLIREAAPTGVS